MTKLTQFLVQIPEVTSPRVYVGNSISEIETLFNVKVIAVLSDIWM